MKIHYQLTTTAGLLAASLGFVMMAGVAAAQVTTSTPLSVSCSGNASSGAITWTATPTGGSPPYTYLWSGDQIDGSTGSSVTAMYAATGTYNAAVQINDTASSTASSTCAAAVTSLPSAGLSIVKTVDNTAPAAGATVDYTLTVSASGPAASTGVTATDLLPSGLSFVSATPSVGNYASSTGLWTIGDMPANSTATLMIDASVDPGTAGEIIANSATVAESSAVTNPDADTSSSATITVANPNPTPTSTTPLSVSCDWGYNASNVITWTASASGGTGPYTYLWSGNQIDGATSTSVTATYPTTGVYTANVQATDAASNTGTATCSASVTSIPSSNPTSTPTSTPPVTPPGKIVPSTLSIEPNGNFLAHGMVVISVGSTSFEGQIWGITYTVNWSGKLPEFLFRNGNNDSNWIPTAQLQVGDEVGVSGSIDPANPLVVNANVVRDYSISAPRTSHGFDDGQGSSHAHSESPSTGNYFETQLNNLFSQLQNLKNLFQNTFGR